mgnify:CR=1 FL=1
MWKYLGLTGITVIGNKNIASPPRFNDISYTTLIGNSLIIDTAKTHQIGIGNDGRKVIYSQRTNSGTTRVLINSTTSDVNAVNQSAAFEINGDDGGFLIPRLNTTQQNAISSPATGLIYEGERSVSSPLPFFFSKGWI